MDVDSLVSKLSEKVTACLIEEAQWDPDTAWALRSALRRDGYAVYRLSCALGSAVDMEVSLIQALAREFDFPGYFGGNWNAVDECLSDLSWQVGTRHVLVIEHWKQLAPSRVRELLTDVLAYASKAWQSRGGEFRSILLG